MMYGVSVFERWTTEVYRSHFDEMCVVHLVYRVVPMGPLDHFLVLLLDTTPIDYQSQNHIFLKKVPAGQN